MKKTIKFLGAALIAVSTLSSCGGGAKKADNSNADAKKR